MTPQDPGSASDLAAQLAAFAEGSIARWTGLPPHAAMSAVRDQFGLSGRVEGRATLGRRRHVALRESFDDRPLVLWQRDGELVLLEFEGPFETLDIENLLGEPEARLDVHRGMAMMASGEWVYPARGLAIIVSSDSGTALRLLGFTPMSLDRYVNEVRRDSRPRPRPSAVREGNLAEALR